MQGLLGITLSAGVPALHGLHAAVNQSAFFVAMLYIVAVGTGAAPHCMGGPLISSAVVTVNLMTCRSHFAAMRYFCHSSQPSEACGFCGDAFH